MSAPTIAVTYESRVSIVETSTDPFVSSEDATTTYDGMNTSETVTASTTPPVTKHTELAQALSAGTKTLDFTAITGPQGVNIDMSGLKLQYAKFANPISNANTISIAGGASNGYLLFGTSGLVVLNPGQEITLTGDDTLADVDGTHKTIDLAGTGSQVLNITVVFG